MKYLHRIAFLALLLTMLTSCEYDFIEVDQPDPEVPVKFSEDIQPIFISNDCIACHKTGGTSPDLTEGKAYNSIYPALIDSGNPDLSSIYTKPHPSSNHSVKYSPEQAALVLAWIKQGAENN